VAALALALLMRRALSPLGRLTSAAAEIEETGDARRRLPVPESGDELARLAATLNRMLAALEHAQERERRFVADASHELRTPLTALSGNVAFLAQHGASDELVAELEHDTKRLAALADDLLALSREEAAAPPSDVVRLDELARSADGADEVVAEPAAVLGDRAALDRALRNLVENARRHGAGRVTVESRTQDGVATLTVGDEGRGLPHPEAELAFGRFWRGGGARAGGSGLGLAIVRATAERHGGRAYAEGARFTIELPALSLRELSEPAATTNGEEQPKGTP
jgi:signal transduction histidine kinase